MALLKLQIDGLLKLDGEARAKELGISFPAYLRLLIHVDTTKRLISFHKRTLSTGEVPGGKNFPMVIEPIGDEINLKLNNEHECDHNHNQTK